MSSPVQDLSVLHQRREQRLMLALALPALLVILLLVVLPVGWLAWQSVYHNGFTLENYRRIWSEDIYWRSFALTFQISVLVTVLALLLGYPIAYAASIASRRWGIIILALVVLPFWTSVLVRAYAWLALLQRTGVIKPERAAQLPSAPENAAKQALMSYAWWSSPAGEAAEKRWVGFMQK